MSEYPEPTGREIRLYWVLAALIADEGLDDAGLDSFMASARALADQWLS